MFNPNQFIVKICLQHNRTTRKMRISQNSKWPGFCWMGRSGHSLHMSFTNGSLTSCDLFITQIRYRDAWIVFLEKVRPPKFVKRNWKIKNNDKDEVQFQTLHRGRMNKERTFRQQSKKVFTWLQFDESKQMFCSFYGEFSTLT